MLPPSLGYGGLFTRFQSTGTLIFSYSWKMTRASDKSLSRERTQRTLRELAFRKGPWWARCPLAYQLEGQWQCGEMGVSRAVFWGTEADLGIQGSYLRSSPGGPLCPFSYSTLPPGGEIGSNKWHRRQSHVSHLLFRLRVSRCWASTMQDICPSAGSWSYTRHTAMLAYESEFLSFRASNICGSVWHIPPFSARYTRFVQRTVHHSGTWNLGDLAWSRCLAWRTSPQMSSPVQVIDARANAQGVHPVPECPLLSRLTWTNADRLPVRPPENTPHES